MAQTRDGLQTPLPPNPIGLLLGVAITGGGIATIALASSWWCAAVPLIALGGLVIANQFGGVTRVRVTHSKLLVEDERLVMGFLVGPSKRRIQWTDYQQTQIDDGEVVVTGKAGTTLRVGKGCPDPELKELERRIEEAVKNYAEEPDI